MVIGVFSCYMLIDCPDGSISGQMQVEDGRFLPEVRNYP